MVRRRGFKRRVDSPDVRPVQAGVGVSNRRRALVLAGQGACLVLFGASLRLVGASTPAPADGHLADRAARLARALEHQAQSALARISPVADQVAGDAPPDWRAFARAVQPADRSGPGIVLWAPRVTGSARADYELATGRDAFRSFRIRDTDGRGGLAPAASRAEHFPIHLVDPPGESNRLLGIDLLSEGTLAGALARARSSLSPQLLLTGTPALQGPPGPQLVVVLPVVRASRLHGLLVAAVPAPALPAEDARLVDGDIAVRLAPWSPGPPSGGVDAAHAFARAPFHVAGHTWAVEVAARRTRILRH
jgi:hypothetical protein